MINIIFSYLTHSYAIEQLNLEISDNKNIEEINIGDTIKVVVSWKEKMQVVDYTLKYNSKKLEFISSDLEEKFINNDTEKGTIKTTYHKR